MEVIEILQELGLSSQETMIYIKLLESGPSLASLISEKTRINRSLVYQILGDLIKKGFVSYAIRNNIRYYSPVSPEKLLELLKEKENKLKLVLPQLNSLTRPPQNKPIIEIFEGKEGIKTILNDILKENKDWLAFGSSGKSIEILPYYVDHWEKERQKMKIPLKGILDTSDTGKKRGGQLSKLKFTEIKYLPKGYTSPTSSWIYGDKTAIVYWSKENPFATRMISKDITNSFRNHFNFLWKIAKR